MAASDEPATEAPDGLMLFDGLCNFCSASVNLALALDRPGAIRFCPIQSPYGRLLAARVNGAPGGEAGAEFAQRLRELLTSRLS